MKLDDEQTYSQFIWITNNLRSYIQIENISSKDKEALKLNRPWVIRDKLAKEKEAEGASFDNFSPIDFWRIEHGQKRPIGEISYTANYEGVQERHLLSSNIKITIRQNIANTDSVLSKELYIPMKFFKRYYSPLVEEDFIDLGIVTSREVTHRYFLKVENRFGKPAVITKVALEKNGSGMHIRVGTMFGYKVVLPASGPAFDLLVLYAQADDKFDIGYAWGKISIYVDVSGQQEVITVPFQACYYHNMFSEEERVSFELKRHVKDGRVINKVEGYFKNNYLTDLVIQDMVFVDFESNKNTASFTSLTKYRRMIVGDSFKAFSAQFTYAESFYDNTFSRGYEVANVRALGTFGSVLIQYYTMNLMCGLHNAISSIYEKCKNIEKLEFAYVAVGHRKVMTMDIYNPTMVSYIIKRIEFSTNSGNIEITFENQSRNGLRSYFKKATKTMNTFVLLPRNDVVSLRVKIRPRETGSFKETITIYTNHGEFSLSVIYKGIQGEILFMPTTLRYDLFYPIESDEKFVTAKNKFNIEVRINNAWSPQSYIFANLRSYSLKENSKDAFLGVILDLTDDEIMETERSGFLRTFNEQYVTLSDLVSFEDQTIGWEKILREAKTEISGEVIVQTDLLSDMKINVKGFIRKALFVPEDKIIVGPLEERRSHLINVTLHNPTERDVTMRFYIADPRMTDLKAIHRKVLLQLKRKYSKYTREQICLTHSTFDEDSIKYYANALFDGVTVKSVGLNKNNYKKVCFQIDNPKAIHEKFYTYKGNYMFNSSRLSRKNMIRDNMDVYLLKDVIRLSNKKPPANPQSLYRLGFYDKLRMIFLHLRSLIRSKFRKNDKFKSKGNIKYVSSVKKSVYEGIVQKQEFFINPKYKNKKIVLPAGQSQTVPAVICHPQDTADLKINLLIKNDYSNLIILPITAQLGRVSLIVQKVIYFNEGATTSIVLKKEEYHKMIFSISSNDLFQKLGGSKDSKKLFFKKNVKRVFELKNNGNLPIKVNSISVDKQGCVFNGFKIVNCNPFELGPGHTYRLEVMLLNTYDFQTDFKREVFFLMDSRVLVLEFEVKTSDPLLSDLSSYGYVNPISNILKIVVVIFMVILILISYKHYYDKQSDINYYVTDFERSRFGSNLYFDNIFDLKVLEANVKYQKLEAQKNRLIRAVGLKELMTTNLKESTSKDHSIISEEPVPEQPEPEPVVEEHIEREPEMILMPAKGKKNKRPKKPSAVATTPSKNDPMDRRIQQPVIEDEILGPIKDELEEDNRKADNNRNKKDNVISQREYREAREREAREIEAREQKEREMREREKLLKESRIREQHNKRPKHKPSYEPESEEEEYYKKPGYEENIIQKSINKSRNSQKTESKPSKRKESLKSEKDSIVSEKQTPEIAVDKKRKASEYLEKQDSIPLNPPRKSSHTEPQQSTKPADVQLQRQDSKTTPKDQSPIENEVKKPTEPEVLPAVKEIQPKKDSPAYRANDSGYSDRHARDRHREGGRRRGEMVYYQRVERNNEESEQQSRDKVHVGVPKHNSKEESTGTGISSTPAQHPYIAPKPSTSFLQPSDSPPKSKAGQEKRFGNFPKGNKNPNKSFSQEGEEEPHDHRSFERFNQTINDISDIGNLEENASNASNIMLLKDRDDEKNYKPTAKPPVKPGNTSGALGIVGPPNINVEDSDDSVDNLERSHEKIRKLMEDTEEVINEDIDDQKEDYHQPQKVAGPIGAIGAIGAIGGEKKPQMSGERGKTNPSALLGFRQSENQYRQYNQFQTAGAGMFDAKPKISNPLFAARPPVLSGSNQGIFSFGQQQQAPERPRPQNPPSSSLFHPQQTVPTQQNSNFVDARTKQPITFKTVSNKFGHYVTRGQVSNMDYPQPHIQYQSSQQPQVQLHQNPYPVSNQYDDHYNQRDYGHFYHSSSGSYGYDNDDSPEAKLSPSQQHFDYNEQQYYGNYEEPYRGGGGSSGGAGYNPFGGGYDTSKQFKAAMNNPFTLKNLAGGKGETQPQRNYMGWLNPQSSYSQGEEDYDYERSGYSEASYGQNKGGMKPPPGLTGDLDSPVEDQKASNPYKYRPDIDVDSDEPTNRQEPKLKLKKSDKPKYN